jgi:hypothetical protein
VVDQLLFRSEGFRARSACCGCGPSGEFSVARLGVLVPEAVNAANACGGALVFEATQLLHVVPLCWNEAAPSGEMLRILEYLALGFRPDRDLACAAALGPSALQREPVTAISPRRLDLDRLGPPQPECGSEFQGCLGVGSVIFDRSSAVTSRALLAFVTNCRWPIP